MSGFIQALSNWNANLNFSLWELLIKGIPEGFLDLFAVLMLTKTGFKKNKYFISSCGFILITFLAKNTLNKGVSTIVSLLGIVILLVLYNRIEITKTIKATLIFAIALIFCEAINEIIVKLSCGANFDFKKLTGLERAVYGIPSTIIFLIVVVVYFLINYRRTSLKKVDDGKAGETDSE